MIRYESSITIDRPPDRTFEFLLDPAHHRDWMTDVTELETLTDGPPGVGSRFRYGIQKGSKHWTLTMRIGDYRPGELVRYQTEPGGPFDWDATFRLEPAADGATRVISFGEMRLKGLMRLIEPLMAGEVRAGEAGELVALKRSLEAADADR
jgi:uncharacterized protein YndB with AHSA1/START domain